MDANQAFTAREFVRLLPSFLEARVDLIEQPLAADEDDALRDIRSPIPLVSTIDTESKLTTTRENPFMISVLNVSSNSGAR